MKKEELKDVLVKYDAKMFTLQEELENIQCVLNREADELRYFKVFTEDVHLQIISSSTREDSKLLYNHNGLMRFKNFEFV